MSEQEFIIELNKENTYLIEEIIYLFPLIYKKVGKNNAFNEELVNQFIDKELFSKKDINAEIQSFLTKITNSFINFLGNITLLFDIDIDIKNIERKNISIQIKNNTIFISLPKIEVCVKMNNNLYKCSVKKFRTTITFTKKGELIINDFDISGFYINYFWIKLLIRSYIFFKKSYIIGQIQQTFPLMIENYNKILGEFKINKLKMENNKLKVECTNV